MSELYLSWFYLLNIIRSRGSRSTRPNHPEASLTQLVERLFQHRVLEEVPGGVAVPISSSVGVSAIIETILEYFFTHVHFAMDQDSREFPELDV